MHWITGYQHSRQLLHQSLKANLRPFDLDTFTTLGLFDVSTIVPVLNIVFQQRKQTQLSLHALKLIQVFLAGMTAKCCVHLLKRLASSFRDEKVNENSAYEEPACEKDVC